MKRGDALLAVLLAVTVLVGAISPVAAVASDDLNTAGWDDEETAPHPVWNGTVTTASQDLTEGTTHEAIAGYEDDNGDWVAGADTPFVVNTTYDVDSGENANPYSYNPTLVDDDDLQAFPENGGEWLNSSNWVAGTNGSNIAVSNSTVASGVDSVEFDTGTTGDSGVSDGYVVGERSFSNFSTELDNDETKRVLQLRMGIATFETNSEIQVRVYDESGSYKEVVANGSGTAFSGNVFATGTGDVTYQVKLSELATQGPDATFDNIENVTIRVVADGTTNADAKFDLAQLDLRKKSKDVLGEQRATTDDDGNDGDSDGEYDEFHTVYNATDSIDVYSMESLGSEFDDAVINDLEYPVRFEAGSLADDGEEGDYLIVWENASNPGYHHVLNATFQITLPSAVDLSYSNGEVRMTQKWAEARYLTLETATGVADSKNLSEVDGTSKLSSLGSQGDVIQLAASPSAGQNTVVHYELQFTNAERNNDVGAQAVPADEDEGEGGGVPAESEGGFWSDPINWVWSGIVAVLGFFGARRFGIIGGGS